MTELPAVLVSATWLGILTSISPCPLTTNIAAISFISRRLESPLRVLLTGVLYTLGRTITYALLGAALSASLVSTTALSQQLQGLMNKLLGPVLVLVGMVLLDLLSFKPSGRGVSEGLQKRAADWGILGALPLGMVFAASFCPITAALFFGAVLASAVQTESVLLVPVAYGVGTAVPVLVFACLVALGGRSLGASFNRLAGFEKWARLVTGIIFVVAGIVYCLRYIFGLF